jgi:hypothetical protein
MAGQSRKIMLASKEHGQRRALQIFALFFQDNYGFSFDGVVFAVGAGYITERGFGLEGSELPDWLFALGVGVGGRSAQVGFVGHGVLGGVERVIGNDRGLRIAGENVAHLSECSGGAEEAKCNDGGLHDSILVWGKRCVGRRRFHIW